MFSKLLYAPFMQNKFVLYGCLFFILIAIIRLLANRNFNAIILMALISLLTTYFSKNMIIVLSTPLVAIILIELTRGHTMIEGFNGGDDENDVDDNEKEGNTGQTTANDASTADKPADPAKPDAKPDATPAAATPAAAKPAAGVKAPAKPAAANKPTEQSTTEKPKQKQGMAKLKPANYNGKDDDEKTENNGNRIDYASTLEQAYDNIENIIGEDGVRGLTDQTKSLMNQQKQLMNNMKDIEPLLKSAQGFMEQMTGNGGLSGISEMLKGFAGSKPAA